MTLTRLAALVTATFLIAFSSTAQTFTQQVQQHHSGEGTVTIHHDADIDRLVNAAPSATKPAAIPTKSATPATRSEASHTKAPKAEKPKAPTKSKSKATKSRKPQDDTTKTKPIVDTTHTKPHNDTTHHRSTDNGVPINLPFGTGNTDPTAPAENDTTAIPAAPRHGYKTTGYRVQAFAGGNSRRDRQKAERTGNALRQLFPEENVYVRFYSPRWVCRVGNYQTYEEAHEMMLNIRKMGYESATIVKGKIIVYTTP